MKKGIYLTFDIKALSSLFTVCAAVALVFVALAAEKTVSVISGSVTDEKPVIIIDAGHGGEDGGTQSADGTLEKDINLSISKKVQKILTRYGFETVMVRDTDKMIYDEGSSTVRNRKTSDLHNRMKIMEAYPDCIFLSIHQNHFSQSKYSGAQVFYCKSRAESAVVADCIQQSIVKSLQKENTRQIKPCTSDVYLIYNAVSTAVMVECGFLSNTQEAEKLKDNTYQYEMALAISKGIVNYLEQKGSVEMSCKCKEDSERLSKYTEDGKPALEPLKGFRKVIAVVLRVLLGILLSPIVIIAIPLAIVVVMVVVVSGGNVKINLKKLFRLNG